MSHTTTIGQILFADEQALRSAAAELKERGIDCDLIENAIPRAYYQNQMGEAPLVLRLNSTDYDVGLYRNKEDTAYAPSTDLWAGKVASQLGVPAEEGVGPQEASIGKLRNAYVTHAIINQANAEGRMVDRYDEADGTVRLTIAA